MRSRLKEAQSAIWRLEEIVKAGVGYDQRVDDLSFCIQRSLEDVNRIDPEVPFGKSLIDTEFGKPLANTKRDLNKEQKFMRIAEAKQYAAELMATGDAEDQRRLAAEGFLPGKISGQEQANQTITDHGHHLRGNGKAPIQAQGMSSTDNGAVTSPGSETLPANGAARNGAKNGAHKVFGTIADDNGPWPAGAVQSGSTASSPTKKVRFRSALRDITHAHMLQTSPRSSTPSSMRLKSFNENFLSPTLTMVKRASRRGGLSGLFARPTEAETESGEQRVPEQAVEDEEIPRGGAVGGAM